MVGVNGESYEPEPLQSQPSPWRSWAPDQGMGPKRSGRICQSRARPSTRPTRTRWTAAPPSWRWTTLQASCA